MTTTAYQIQKSPEHPHIAWIELNMDGTLHECAVLKEDPNGNLMYFQINHLDSTDKARLTRLLHDRNARTFELWDLMANKTLGNGVNALEYFHQLVKILTPQGKTLDPKLGQVGVGVSTGTVKVGNPSLPVSENTPTNTTSTQIG